MTVHHYLSILIFRRVAILSFVAAAIVVIMGATLMLPKTYTATATLLIDVKLNDPLGGVALGQALLPETLQAYLKTQAEIISGERSTRNVISSLKLEENQVYREKWQASPSRNLPFEDWLLGAIRKKLDIGPSRDSTVISITFSDTDRAMAASVANAFAKSYLETDLALKVEPARKSATFYDERTKVVREKLERAQSKLSEHQRRKGMVATDERLDVENARLAELSTQLTIIQATANESDSKQRQVGSLSEVIASPSVQAMRGDLAKAEAKLREMGSQFGPNHPQYQRTEEEVKSLRERVAIETQQVAGTVGATSRVNRQREESTKAAYEAQRTKVMSMRVARDEASLLIHDVDNAKKEYDALLQRFGQTSLESKVTQTNATILNNAAVPLDPSSPKLLLNLVLAIFVGVLGGIALAAIREALDRRVRGTSDIVELFQLPVLGVLQSTGHGHGGSSGGRGHILPGRSQIYPNPGG
ncbi:MAG: chain length determinant protein EpsF [Burkholderiales bacterium]